MLDFYTRPPESTVAVRVLYEIEGGDVVIVAAVGDDDSKNYADAIRRDPHWLARVERIARGG